MSTRPVVDLSRRRLWLTQSGQEQVGEAFERHGVAGWYGPGYICVQRVAPEHWARLRAELRAIAVRATEPAGW